MRSLKLNRSFYKFMINQKQTYLLYHLSTVFSYSVSLSSLFLYQKHIDGLPFVFFSIFKLFQVQIFAGASLNKFERA